MMNEYDNHNNDDLYEELDAIGEIDLDDAVEPEIVAPTRLERPAIADTIAAMGSEGDEPIAPVVFYGLSGLSRAELVQLAPAWEALPAAYRRRLIRQMVEIGESDFEMDYNAIGKFALDDTDPVVRAAAIEMLFEDFSFALMDRLIGILHDDESREVRAAAASALGRFILAGELEDLPESETVRAQEAVVSIFSDENEDVEVRRRALEAIANCSHEVVEEAIREGYASFDRRMRASSLFAMGRSCDEQWSSILLRELESDDAEMRYEAARAVGEIEVPEAVPNLIRLAFDADREIKQVAIWSLGEIGGRDAVRALTRLMRDAETGGDDDLQEAIDEALANAMLVDDDLRESRWD